MISVDTNILLRLIAEDDPGQYAAARQLVEANDVFVSLFALVEAEWVLRSAYGWPVEAIANALEALVLAPRIYVESPSMASWALGRFRGGADLADMVHLVNSRETEAFASFERRLAQQAGPDTPVPVLRLS